MITLNDGNRMPQILFGTYLINEEIALEKCLDVALGSGYRGIDTASVYRNEEMIGKALKKLLPKYNLKRSDIFITSKISPRDQGYEEATLSINKSLKLLNSDGYIDLILLHWPGKSKYDPSDLENQMSARLGSWRALIEARKKGIVKSIGVSNFLQRHLNELNNNTTGANVIPAVNQVECHPFLNQNQLVDFCKKHDIHFQAYSSLGSTAHHEKLMDDPVIIKVAKESKKTVSQVLLRWAIQRDISILPKSINPDHIRSNLEVFNWKLSDDQMDQLNNLNKEEHFCWDPSKIA